MSSEMDKGFHNEITAANGRVEKINDKINALRKERVELVAARNRLLMDRELAIWGVTEEQYQEAKSKSANGQGNLAQLLNAARSKNLLLMKQAQTAKTSSAGVGAKGYNKGR